MPTKSKTKKQTPKKRGTVRDLDAPIQICIDSLTHGFLVASIVNEREKLKLLSINLTLEALALARASLQKERDDAQNNPDLDAEAKKNLVQAYQEALQRLRDIMVSINSEFDPLLDQLTNERQRRGLRVFINGIRERLGLPRLF